MLVDKNGVDKFTEGRAIFFSKVTMTDKVRLMRGVPKNAKYWRECVAAHWKMKIEQNVDEISKNIGGEPFWRSWRFKIDVDFHTRRYFSQTVDVKRLIDIIDGETGRPFTENRWRGWIEHLHEAYLISFGVI